MNKTKMFNMVTFLLSRIFAKKNPPFKVDGGKMEVGLCRFELQTSCV